MADTGLRDTIHETITKNLINATLVGGTIIICPAVRIRQHGMAGSDLFDFYTSIGFIATCLDITTSRRRVTADTQMIGLGTGLSAWANKRASAH